MEAEHKLRIQGNYTALVSNVAVIDVQDHLFQHGLLTDEEQEWISMKTITRQEGVRRLIKIIKKKPNAFHKFCEALEEPHGWLAEQIRNTDPTTVNPADDTDGVDEEKMKALQSQLWMTTQLMQQFKQEIDNLRTQVQVQSDENKEVKDKFNKLAEEMQARGLKKQGPVVEYLEDYVTKKEHPNRAAIECPDGSSVDSRPNLRRFSMGNPSDLTEAIARHLAVDVVRFMVHGEANAKKPSNKYAAEMRICVSILATAHSDMFSDFVDRLEINQINGFETLGAVTDSIFLDGQNNWGRVAVLYAFGGYIAQNAVKGEDELAEMIGDFLGFYVSTKLGPWIEEIGGWENFVEFSQERNSSDTNNQLYKGILVSILALGAVVGTVVAAKKS